MANSSDDGGETRSKDQDDARASTPPEANTRTERHTERPVAHSVKPPPPAPSTKRGFVWVAMLGLFGVVGFMLREPDAETALAARAPNEPPLLPAAALEPAPVESEANTAPADVSAPSDPATPTTTSDAPAPAPLDTTSPVAPAKPAREVSAARVAAARTLAPPAPPQVAPDAAAIAPSAAAPVKPGPFNHKAANVSLDQSAKAASTCRRGTDPSGVARAVVSFAPTGRVTAAVISGPPFAGTETGSCIARALRQSVIPAFEGSITTVAKTVEVQ